VRRLRLIAFAILVVPHIAAGQDAARALARSGHYTAAIALYDSVLAREPRNWDAALGRAQVIAWSGHLAAAESTYRALIDSGAGPDAEKGLARVVAWRGRLSESERIYRSVIAHDSTDTEALTGLATVLEWEGRPREARAALMRGLAAHPDDGDAKEAWLKLRPIVSPSIRPTVTAFGDNEHNSGIAGALSAEDGLFTFGATYREAEGLGLFGRTETERAGVAWTDPHISLRADAGAGEEDQRAEAIGAGHLAVTAGPMTLTAGGSRELFDETAGMIASGLVQTMADAELDLGGHLTTEFGYANVGGGQRTDERFEGSAYLWTGAWHGFALGAGSHGYGYLRPDTVDRYFAPASFILAEGAVRSTIGGERGLGATIEVGAGGQRIAAFEQAASIKPAERVNATVTYTVEPGITWGVTGGYAVAASPNAATATAAAAYRGYSVALVARLIP
jgi:tetratricopeptide (TPR) repeat protein